MQEQFDAEGRLRHLISLEHFDDERLTALLDKATGYLRPAGELPAHESRFGGRTVANLFFEPSTRTRASFELAAKRLGLHVLNLDVRMSSRSKGESILDTVYTLEAMGSDIFVLRDSEPGVPAFIASHVEPHVSVLSAGEADVSHPTQGLLDTLTIRQHKQDIANCVVTLIGDISHSRVARSVCQALAILGARQVRLVAPPAFMPGEDDYPHAERFSEIEPALRDADVVMALRIQRERMSQASIPDTGEYFKQYGLTAERLALARPDAIVMHPGPMNRGVEIASEVADGPQSVIRRQVCNGVAVRMAVMATVLETLHP
ncbi:MAG: aspartate carbamoyltransferase catalytic subunit [Chromatiales bacterium]|jgi:aspartate carbamoyltransferase catalytic subunit